MARRRLLSLALLWVCVSLWLAGCFYAHELSGLRADATHVSCQSRDFIPVQLSSVLVDPLRGPVIPLASLLPMAQLPVRHGQEEPQICRLRPGIREGAALVQLD